MVTRVEAKTFSVQIRDLNVSASSFELAPAMREAGRIAANRLLDLEMRTDLLSEAEAREWRTLRTFLRWKALRWSGTLKHLTVTPAFLQDERLTRQDLRNKASRAREEEWVRLAGLILRKGDPEDVLTCLRLAEVCVRWPELRSQVLGRAEFWEWLFAWWGLLDGRRPPTRINRSLLTEFWIAQGLPTRPANVLAFEARVYSLREAVGLSAKEIHALSGMGKNSAAKLLSLLENLGNPERRDL